MRLDQFLKNSRLVKRRSTAREMCENGRVLVNQQEARPAKDVKPGDDVTLVFASRTIIAEITEIPPVVTVSKTSRKPFMIKSDLRISEISDS